MAISREEIDQIAEATAQKVVAKAQGNPVKQPMYSECFCGKTVMNMASALYHTLEDSKRFGELTPMHATTLDLSFSLIESGCPADMAKLQTIITDIKKMNAMTDRQFDEALEAMSQAFSGCMEEARKE